MIKFDQSSKGVRLFKAKDLDAGYAYRYLDSEGQSGLCIAVNGDYYCDNELIVAFDLQTGDAIVASDSDIFIPVTVNVSSVDVC